MISPPPARMRKQAEDILGLCYDIRLREYRCMISGHSIVATLPLAATAATNILNDASTRPQVRRRALVDLDHERIELSMSRRRVRGPTGNARAYGASGTEVDRCRATLTRRPPVGFPAIVGEFASYATAAWQSSERARHSWTAARGKPMSTDAIFRIASMTKAITSTAIMMLVEEGRSTWTRPRRNTCPALANRQVFTSFNAVDGTYKSVPAKQSHDRAPAADAHLRARLRVHQRHRQHADQG